MSFYCQKRKKKLGKKPHSQQSAFFLESKKLYSAIKFRKKGIDKKLFFVFLGSLQPLASSKGKILSVVYLFI